MNYRKLRIKLTDKYWDTDNSHRVWRIVKRLNRLEWNKRFPNSRQVNTKSDMYLRLYE